MNTPPLPKLLESKAYERAVTAWDGPRITIISPANKAIAHIPLNFVIQGGDNTWAYVIGVARQLVVEEDGWIFDGIRAVNSVDPPFAGTFVYSSQGRNFVNYSSGPFYTTPYKPAEVDGSQSSHRSYATTPNAQASFRELVRIRDTCCSLTGTLFFSCEAAHIIPKSRPDVYRAILGLRDEEPVSEMFQASAGLLLRPDLHKAFDNLDISLYYKDGMIYAHSFRLHDAMQYHGMAIPSTRWHIPIPEYWPKPEFLQWHYRQCLMARFRGFSAA